MERVYAFVDGAYLRTCARSRGIDMVDPAMLAAQLLHKTKRLHTERSSQGSFEDFSLRRTLYFDARHDSSGATPLELENYWDELEKVSDVQLGWGSVRGDGKKRRQKRVDTLLSVAMIVGAYQRLFDTAVLIAADEDFVPAVEEIRRIGIRVILGIIEYDSSSMPSSSGLLLRSVDRRVSWPIAGGWAVLTSQDGKTFPAV